METLKLYRVEIKGLGKFDKVLDNQNMQQAKDRIRGSIYSRADLDVVLSTSSVGERRFIWCLDEAGAYVCFTRLS